MTKPTVLDPVTRYATDVVALRVVAGLLVRLACQRHLNDLRDATAKSLLWKPDEAQEAIDFFPECLCLPEETDADEDSEELEDLSPEAGTPFVLSPFQQFIVGSLFGWFAVRVSQKTGVRRERQRFRIAFFQGGKGCGKTPLGAGILIFMLVRRGVRGAQLFCAGAMKEQALIPFADCVKMRESSEALKKLITLTGNNLAVKATGSFIRPISSDKRSQSGKRVQGAVIEELHEHPSAGLYLKMRAGIKGRPNALLFLPTNTGFDLESVCYETYDYACQILEGTVVNESFFAFVCHLDPCAKCRTAGKRQPSDDCQDCDDWKVEGPHWLKANPNLGVSIPWQYLRDEVRVAIDVPSQRNMVRRLNFCQWTQQATVWITTELWSACTTTAPERFRASLEGRECFLGIDLSDKIDLSSVVCIFPRALEREPAAEQAADDEGLEHQEDVDAPAPSVDEDRPTIDCAIDVLPFFWMPAKTLARRAQEDKIPYPDWERDGYITTWPGSLIDHDAICEFIIAELAKRYRIRGIGIDQAGAAGVVNKLKRQFGEELVDEVPQGFRSLTEASKLMEALVITVNVAHEPNPCMAMCMANMGKEENAWREIRPVKLNQRKRIDGGVALIDAIWKMTKTPAAPRSVYETRGLVTSR
jgi:phage terminase large subunit-like protein